MKKLSLTILLFLISINASSKTIGLECEGTLRKSNLFYKESIFLKIDMENETSTMCEASYTGPLGEVKRGFCKNMDSVTISDFEITGKHGKEQKYYSMFDMYVTVGADRFELSREDLSIEFNTYFLSNNFEKGRDNDEGWRKTYKGMCILIESEKIDDKLKELKIINEEYLQEQQRQKELLEKKKKDDEEKKLKERKI